MELPPKEYTRERFAALLIELFDYENENGNLVLNETSEENANSIAEALGYDPGQFSKFLRPTYNKSFKNPIIRLEKEKEFRKLQEKLEVANTRNSNPKNLLSEKMPAKNLKRWHLGITMLLVVLTVILANQLNDKNKKLKKAESTVEEQVNLINTMNSYGINQKPFIIVSQLSLRAIIKQHNDLMIHQLTMEAWEINRMLKNGDIINNPNVLYGGFDKIIAEGRQALDACNYRFSNGAKLSKWYKWQGFIFFDKDGDLFRKDITYNQLYKKMNNIIGPRQQETLDDILDSVILY